MAAAAADWATEEEAAKALWLVLRPGFMIVLFAFGWAGNVWVFNRFRVDYSKVLGLAKDDLVTVPQLVMSALLALLSLAMLFLGILISGVSAVSLRTVLLCYVLAVMALFVWLPQPLARRARWREPLARTLYRCIVPEEGKEVPFVEVLVADGLTSVAKALSDLANGTCVVASSSLWHEGSFLGLGVSLTGRQKDSRSRLGAGLEDCARSPFPFLALALPFLIRARQCLVTSRNAPDGLSRSLQLVNLAKYMSALPVIVFAMIHDRYEMNGVVHDVSNRDSGGHEPPWVDSVEALWALAAIVNAVFSFLWDMTMDWGLMNPAPYRTKLFGLRPTLLLRDIWAFYYFAILCNSLGRTAWTLRWSSSVVVFMGSFALSSVLQVAEVSRRCLWNILRVEWECIRKSVPHPQTPVSVYPSNIIETTCVGRYQASDTAETAACDLVPTFLL
eukprot:TRINITY_DN70526_c0_g1_i1.p1 TRINITY_DN70526_c0_g1~~TRINITY_DN70526_c0_g1_i1.p1  ORF type:complete len:517 (-),score=70.13 TRINITY_DN70526_c0_g1_i1:23-1360(-)